MTGKSHTALIALATAIFGASVLQGTGPTMVGDPYVDSANVARAAYARASAALRANDQRTARTEAARAANAWPTQPTYLWARVVVGMRMRDTAAVLDALTRYAALGLGRDLVTDTAMRNLITHHSFRAVAEAHATNLAPMVRGQPWAVLPDSTFYPEGIDVDPRSGLTYVASVRHRTIAELTPRGDYIRELLPRGGVGLGAFLAVRVDAPRGVLWATTAGIPQTAGYTQADSNIHALLRLNIATGEIERRWDLAPSPNGHTLGDVAIGPLGDVFTSDSRDPVLYRLPADSTELRPIRHPLFRSLQGIAPVPDGRTVIVADYSHGLLRVDALTGEVRRIADGPNMTSLGCDGISWYDGAIIAVQNGIFPPRIMRFDLDSSWTKITRATVLDRHNLADEPTIGTIVGDDFLYVANSQWEKYSAAGALQPRATLKRPVLIRVPARR
jgi:sugar lactone lactonase YvrE